MKAKFFMIFISLLFTLTLSQVPIGGGDHDIISHKLILIRHILEEKSIDQLRINALKIEQYIKSKTDDLFVGGIHDYVDELSKEELIQYIISVATTNKELLEEATFNSIVEPQLIGGGLHDMLYAADRKSLENYALASEKYMRKKNGQEDLLGGLHDYIVTLSDEEVRQYIVKANETNPELTKTKLISLCNEYGFVNEVSNLGGLHDYVNRLDRQTLENWALSAEKYERIKRKVNLLGGLHDYISRLSDKEVADYILKANNKYPELNKEKFESLSMEYGFTPVQANLGGLHDFIYTLDRETLNNYAYASEKYDRKKNGIDDHIKGGLVDYLFRLSDREVADYVLEMNSLYPELSKQKLDSLCAEYGLVTPILKLGGLHDYLVGQDRKTLENFALVSETYYRKNTGNEGLLGGLHDYIQRLSNDEVIEYILEKNKMYPELNFEKLQSLTLEYGLITPKQRGGLHDYIFRLDRATLTNWALVSERYVRELKDLRITGGLHDYIDRLSNEDIANYILEKASEFPELNREKLDELTIKYGYVKKSSTPILGGLHDYVWQLDINTLKKWSLSAEKYERQEKNVILFGGLHDYIDSLSKNDLIDYVLAKNEKYPELTKQKFEALCIEYGYNN